MDPNAKTRLSEQGGDPWIGRTVGGYRIEAVLGRGGMGTVYRARQLSLGRPVAIKVLPLDLAGEEQFLERFHREADALSRLSHPNVVTVFDRGEVDGQPYLVMEYVEGTSLREMVREKPLALLEALRIATAVLAALDHAHEKGIVHRDIKPENVLLSRDGVVKVADFGLSRLLGPDHGTRLTRTQLVLGTYEYMAPEQREHAREADPRSDLFATAVVLYEMLTAELPIGRFTLPSQRRPEDCDARVDALVERGLEKNPARRFQSAREMSEAIAAIQQSPQPQAAPVAPARPVTGYRPVRFEYHLDNLATIDHVLGTIGYVLGFVALFGGLRLTRAVWIGAPFLIFFLAGWYLRATAEGLRRYRQTARTSQAVIAILGAFTGILVPLSIYSLWVLFSHRGRTYYDARGRGLDEQAAARHTYRVLEEPYAHRAPTAPPRPPRPPVVPPRPSQIPVQSIVTSDVRPQARPPRRSRIVNAGLWALTLTIVGVVLITIGHFAVPHLKLMEGMGYFATAGLGLAAALFVLGMFRALLSSVVTGAGAAFLGLFVCGVLGLGAGLLILSVREPSRRYVDLEAPGRAAPEQYLGHYVGDAPSDFERDFFRENGRVEWLESALGGMIPGIRLVRRGKMLYVQCPAVVPDKDRGRIALAVQRLVDLDLDGSFEPVELKIADSDWEFLRYLDSLPRD